MHCNFEYFKFLFNLQKRKSTRNNEYDYLCIINFNHRGYKNYDTKETNKISREWAVLLETTLRKGDVFTFWNDSQILIMLHDVKGDGISVIENRIIKNMKNYARIHGNDINMIFQPLVSENTLI